MIKIVEGNILESKEDILIHQTNCYGVMGSGLAKQIREKWPEVYKCYKSYCAKKKPKELLGGIQFVSVPGHTIVNLFGQLKYGGDRQHTDYEALKTSLKHLRYIIEFHNDIAAGKSIAIPYNLGCGLGGGNWDIVYEIIKDVFKDFPFDVTIYKLPEVI